MSSATIESPVASSQLFFAWSEQAEVGVAPPVARRPSVAEPNKPTTKQPSAAASELAVGAKPIRKVAAESSETPSRKASCLSFTRDARIAQPVRMGAVMIKLLKRYGITDQEIAEGVANYARKHQQALAS
ncbi:MAG: hypothetical protein ABI557_21620 [Aureliella sp.]